MYRSAIINSAIIRHTANQNSAEIRRTANVNSASISLAATANSAVRRRSATEVSAPRRIDVAINSASDTQNSAPLQLVQALKGHVLWNSKASRIEYAQFATQNLERSAAVGAWFGNNDLNDSPPFVSDMPQIIRQALISHCRAKWNCHTKFGSPAVLTHVACLPL